MMQYEHTNPTCRRVQRSNIMRMAVHYQLRYCQEMFGVEAVILADRRGLMVAASDEEIELSRVLAAYAPLIVQACDRTTRKRIVESMSHYMPRAMRERISVRRLELFGEEMYLCTFGTRGARKEMAICRAISGVQRIIEQMTQEPEMAGAARVAA